LFENAGDVGDGDGLDLLIESPALSGAVKGVRDLEGGPDLSPRRTKVSIDFSRFPLNSFKIMVFFLSSMKPISLSWTSLVSKSPEE
jgi:hypothetical protein